MEELYGGLVIGYDVDFKPDGSMSCGVWYLDYYPPFETICLDGHFDIAELERIIKTHEGI
jgi:hypothetical protein